jgi:uncharacterized membrane protein YeiH
MRSGSAFRSPAAKGARVWRSPFAAVPLGMLTGIGGSSARCPRQAGAVVLRTEVYAIAALAGAAIVVAGHLLHWPPTATTISGAMFASSCA